jgi:UPF0716 protein FxsA
MLRLRSQGRFVQRPLGRLPARILTYFALWLAAELAAFGAVVHAIGFVGAVIACILTTLAGLAMLRRIGVSAALRLWQAANAREHNSLSRDKLFDGTLAGLGAVLLILPGFVSDFAGLALAAPSIRVWVIDRLSLGRIGRQGRRPAAPALIDLTPREWSRREEESGSPNQSQP